MELQEILLKRQSIRHYKKGDVPREAIEKIVRAAGTAPSGKNTQHWHFVCIKNRALIDKIAQVIIDKNEVISQMMDLKDKEKGDKFRKFVKNLTLFFLDAPVLVVVYTSTYFPSGYHEMTFAEMPKETTDDIVYFRSPGMQSLGAALENFTLKAIDLGYGTCWLTSANYAAKEIEALLLSELGFEKKDYFMGAMMSLGIPEENAKSPKKKTFDEIFTYVE